MELSRGYAKITQSDVRDLNRASEALASAASTIQTVRPQWGNAVIRLLIEANDVIVRVQNKGAGAITRYIEKFGTPGAPDPTDAPGTSETEAVPDLEQSEGR